MCIWSFKQVKFNVKICSELLSLKELFYFGVHVPFQPLSTPKLKHILLMLIKFSVFMA